MSSFLRKLKKNTIDRFDTKEHRLYTMQQITLLMVDEVIKEAEIAELTNTQAFLDWLDALNERSVKY